MARLLRVVDGERGTVVAERVLEAGSFGLRLRGLLGRGPLGPEEGLLLTPCNAIHTFFMPGPIDAVFLDAAGRVVGVAERLPPWRARRVPGARRVLELPAGAVARHGLAAGRRLRLEPLPIKASGARPRK